MVRRSFKLSVVFGAVSAAASLSDLRVEHLLAPEGVDVAVPRFSWLLDSDGSTPRGEAQASYRIVVTPTAASWQQPAAAAAVWDSGVVSSSKNYLIDFGGAAVAAAPPALVSDTNYTWSVSVVSSSGATSAATSTFRTGLFARSDWGDAAWITGGDASRVLRREFTLSGAPDPQNSRVYVSGIGYFELECNGEKLGDHELDIGWTDYSKRVLYTSFDLAPCLAVGQNVLGVTLGAGWFARKTDFGGGQPGSHDAPPQLLLSARIRAAADGALTTVNSAATAGPVPPGPAPGPGPASSGTCLVEKEGVATTLDCGGSKIASVKFATYGTLTGACPSLAAGTCAADLTALVKAGCVGQSKCAVECPASGGKSHACTAGAQTAAIADPCFGTAKMIGVEVTCDGAPSPAPPSPAPPTPPPTPKPAADDWVVGTGPIVYDSLYNGEHYNATMEMPGWSTAGFDASAWGPAFTAATDSASSALLAYQLFEPIKHMSTWAPRNITQPKPGMWVVDFGQNIAGRLRLTMRGQAPGSVVTLRHSELHMHPPYGAVDGTLYYGNLRSAQATDTYVAKGGASETYEPTFTQHGYRFAEITGLTASTLEAADIVSVEVRTALEQTGSATFESPLFNQIQSNTAWGHKSNVMSVPTDCNQRDERRGWMGDAALIAESTTYNFEPAAFYTAWINQVQDDQASDGATANFVPDLGSSHGAPNWQSAYPTTIWSQFKYAGDLGLVQKHWGGLKLYANYWIGKINTSTPTSFPSGFGDWVPAGPKADTHLTGMFAAMHDMGIIAEMAAAVGDVATASACKAARAKAGAEFHKQWYDAAKKGYNTANQAENAMALWVGADVTPDAAEVAAVVNTTISDIFDAHGGHTTAGIIGIKALYEVMSSLGHADVPVRMNEITTEPSYGYMITNEYEPATTMWELWNSDSQGPGMNSRNHIMFGSVSSWFYRYLCGLDVPGRDGVVGYDKISIHPMGVGVTNSSNNAASCSIKTPRGGAASSWRAPAVNPASIAAARGGAANPVALNATVPIGSAGTVRVPLVAALGHSAATIAITEGGAPVWQDGKFVAGVAGISGAALDVGPGIEGEGVVFTVGSGSYAFVAV
jgi:hypothetical protein